MRGLLPHVCPLVLLPAAEEAEEGLPTVPLPRVQQDLRQAGVLREPLRPTPEAEEGEGEGDRGVLQQRGDTRRQQLLQNKGQD